MMHPSSGLWRCAWSLGMMWSSPVLDRHHQGSKRQSASVPRLVCFSGSKGETAATCCLVIMHRMCFHTHWWVNLCIDQSILNWLSFLLSWAGVYESKNQICVLLGRMVVHKGLWMQFSYVANPGTVSDYPLSLLNKQINKTFTYFCKCFKAASQW